MKEPDPGSWVSRGFGACLLVLLGAMALDGAVRIVENIWIQLSLGALAIAVLAGAWLALQRYRGW